MSLVTPEKIRKLQRALYVKAKQEPTRRVAGPGYRQFPIQAVFGTLGVLSRESCPRLARSAARMP